MAIAKCRSGKLSAQRQFFKRITKSRAQRLAAAAAVAVDVDATSGVKTRAERSRA